MSREAGSRISSRIKSDSLSLLYIYAVNYKPKFGVEHMGDRLFKVWPLIETRRDRHGAIVLFSGKMEASRNNAQSSPVLHRLTVTPFHPGGDVARPCRRRSSLAMIYNIGHVQLFPSRLSGA